MSLFEIRRRRPGPNITRVFDTAAKRGLAVGQHATNAGKGIVAGTKNFLGFLTRDVAVGGPTLQDKIFPLNELPFTAAQEVSLELAHEIECEGSDYIKLASTGAISGATAVGTQLSVENGLWYVAQAGDQVFGILTGSSGLDAAGVLSETGALRIRVEVLK